MEPKKLFVIMPYGGDDPKEQGKRESVLQYIIKPAADQCGYQAFIETESGAGGHIPRNIVRHIGDSELVLADISMDNGNVFYELGISHVFHRGKTIMICEKGKAPKFDVTTDKIIFYSYAPEDFLSDAKKIAEAIREREAGSAEYEDSDVPLAYPTLPVSLAANLKGGAGSNQDQIKSLTERITALTDENATLQARLDKLGIQNSDVAAFNIDEALQNEMFSGNQGLIALRDSAEAQPFVLKNFYEILEKVLNARYHELGDYYQIATLCQEKDLPSARRMVLEKAYSLNPTEDKTLALLINFYKSYPDTLPKAIEMVNDLLGLEFKNGKPTIPAERIKAVSESKFLIFCNVYLAARRYQDIINLADYLVANHSSFSVSLLENKALAQANCDQLDEAGKTYEALFKIPEAMADADAHKFYGDYWDKMKRDDLEYEQDEYALALEPDSGVYYFNLASDLMSNLYLRTPQGILKVTREQAIKACVPFLWAAFLASKTQQTFSEVINFALRAKMDFFPPLFQSWVKGEEPSMDDFDVYPLNYCQTLKVVA